jgi:hypothetical protein
MAYITFGNNGNPSYAEVSYIYHGNNNKNNVYSNPNSSGISTYHPIQSCKFFPHHSGLQKQSINNHSHYSTQHNGSYHTGALPGNFDNQNISGNLAIPSARAFPTQTPQVLDTSKNQLIFTVPINQVTPAAS